ncbi:MAG TPA: indole-3-glycerol phosphate synthase TrpC [Candidatus Alistipes merdigallinarum]|nr:indole-3-glycerol phosphate synthase TrpC [Candidatus Alistipes merdigallinarum]
MKDILQEIVATKRAEVDRRKRETDLQALYRQAETPHTVHSLREALLSSSTGIISEFKRRSPSKGWINREADVQRVVRAYQQAGATALSVLTDTPYFGGTDDDLRAARQVCTLPILRKDFTIDEFQLVESRALGADAVLLIAAALTREQCRRFAETAHQLELEVLLEIHDQSELDYYSEYVDILGVNNRNLGSFHTDVTNSFRLIEQMPQEATPISESGISNPDTVKKLRAIGFKGFLIGENFMKTEAPGDSLKNFINALN